MSDPQQRPESSSPGTTNPEERTAPNSAAGTKPERRELLPLPGLVAISLYLLLLSVVIVVGSVGGHYPRIFLILPVFLLAACGGLLMLFRWAWAMALAAVVLLSGYNLWIFARFHLAPSIIQGLLNLVFFLYLIRVEVREKLR
ncbi:MAG TPA: hypothetical protein VN753_15500 [Terracidiphilus sp.]|nr:hypothetical protein [Terracidiphilus sp.]